MPKLLMYLFANDYGFPNWLAFPFVVIFVLILLSFIVVLIARKMNKINQTLVFDMGVWLIVIVIFIVFLIFGSHIPLISPKEIPEHGTDAQKAKMVYCVQQYMRRNGVGLQAVKQSNISEIMKECQEIDKETVIRQNDELQDKQLCESIKSIDSKGILIETNSHCSSSKSD